MRMKKISRIPLTQNTMFFVLNLFLAFVFFLPVYIASAQATFVPLAGIPGVTPSSGGLADYLNKLYIFLIVVGAILGAIKISIAGAKYALSDIITDKASAKKDIQGVLLGLAILLIPYVVLSTIYSGLTNLNILRLAP